MKTWKKLLNLKRFNHFRRKCLGEKGQSIVEFVLLLSAIASISYFFMGFMNANIARYWEYSVNLIVNDSPAKPKKLNIR
jgi:hypothetical protein